jgi:hypothetical protein
MPPKHEEIAKKKKTKGKHKRGAASSAGAAQEADTGDAVWDWQTDDGSQGWFGGWGSQTGYGTSLDAGSSQPVANPNVAESSEPPPRKKKKKRPHSPVADAVADAVDAAASAAASTNVDVADVQAAPAAAQGAGTITIDLEEPVAEKKRKDDKKVTLGARQGQGHGTYGNQRRAEEYAKGQTVSTQRTPGMRFLDGLVELATNALNAHLRGNPSGCPQWPCAHCGTWTRSGNWSC